MVLVLGEPVGRTHARPTWNEWIQSGSGCAEYITNGSCDRAATRPVSPARDKSAGSTFVAGAVAAGKDRSGVRALFHINTYECLSIVDDELCFSCENWGDGNFENKRTA